MELKLKHREIIDLAFLIPAGATADDKICADTAKQTQNPNEILVALRAAVAAEAEADMKEFCEWNRLEIAHHFHSKSTDEAAFSKKFEAIKKSRNKKAMVEFQMEFFPTSSETIIIVPWARSLLGASLLKTSISSNSFFVSENGRRRPAYFAEIINQVKDPFPSRKDPYPTPKTYDDRNLLAPSSTLAGLCTFLIPSEILGCVRALTEGLKSVKMQKLTGGDMPIPAIEPMLRTLSDPNRTEGLRRALLKVHERITDPILSEGANLYDDIKTAFESAGASQKLAEEHTWDLLAAISNGGPNTGMRLPPFPWGNESTKDNPNAMMLVAIAELIPHVDTVAMAQEHPATYSLPKHVKFSCDSGKWYHFWMAGYLARELKKKGHSENSAAAAAYAMQLGYQVNRDSLKRSDLMKFPRYSSDENSIRIDLALAVAGARFGATGKDTKLDLENKFISSIKDTGHFNFAAALADLSPTQEQKEILHWFENVNAKYFWQEVK